MCDAPQAADEQLPRWAVVARRADGRLSQPAPALLLAWCVRALLTWNPSGKEVQWWIAAIAYAQGANDLVVADQLTRDASSRFPSDPGVAFSVALAASRGRAVQRCPARLVE